MAIYTGSPHASVLYRALPLLLARVLESGRAHAVSLEIKSLFLSPQVAFFVPQSKKEETLKEVYFIFPFKEHLVESSSFLQGRMVRQPAWQKPSSLLAITDGRNGD